jgi:hypothetical protein
MNVKPFQTVSSIKPYRVITELPIQIPFIQQQVRQSY